MTNNNNRNPIKQMFITFPKSTVDKNTFRDKLLRFDPEYYKICEEHHKDGTPHLHAVIKYKNKYSKARVLNYFKEIFPEDYKRIDVQPVRSIAKSLQYLSKEDKEPLESGPYQESRNPQSSWHDKFARELGYNNKLDLVNCLAARQETLDALKKDVAERWTFFSLNYPDFNPSYKVLKLYDDFMDDKLKKKDDITFLLEQLNIKAELTRAGGFL